MMMGSKLTAKGQTTIPKKIRDYLGLKPGDRVIFLHKDGDVIIQAIGKSLLDLRGSVKPRNQPEDFEEIRRKVKRGIAEKIARG
jgi:AbrB family looped-hinge helix DNA binding protein